MIEKKEFHKLIKPLFGAYGRREPEEHSLRGYYDQVKMFRPEDLEVAVMDAPQTNPDQLPTAGVLRRLCTEAARERRKLDVEDATLKALPPSSGGGDASARFDAVARAMKNQLDKGEDFTEFHLEPMARLISALSLAYGMPADDDSRLLGLQTAGAMKQTGGRVSGWFWAVSSSPDIFAEYPSFGMLNDLRCCGSDLTPLLSWGPISPLTERAKRKIDTQIERAGAPTGARAEALATIARIGAMPA